MLPGFFITFINYGVSFINSGDLFILFAAGTFAGIIIDHLFLRKIPGLETFEHELTHTLTALAFFRKVTGFRITKYSGGSMSFRSGFGGEFGDDFIGLSPYFLPTFTFILSLVYPLLSFQNISSQKIYWGIAGFTFGFHIWSTLRETKGNWSENLFSRKHDHVNGTDISKRGMIYSTIFILFFTLLFHGIILVLFLKGYNGIPDLFKSFWDQTRNLISSIL